MFAALNNLSESESDTESANDFSLLSNRELLERPVDISNIRDIRPRGLLNQRNNCYLNAVLQSLFAFNDFRVIVHKLNFVLENLDLETTPVCLALHILYQQWLNDEVADMSLWKCPSIYPQSFEEILSRFSENDAGSHEDAHEFFHHLIDSMHEELSRLQNFQHNTTGPKSSSTGFVAVPSKRKNRVVINLDETPISRLFCGRLRCIISKKNLQHCVPFFSLQLPLDPSRSQSIHGLLSGFSAPAKLMARKEGKPIHTVQTSLVDAFPEILALHLKRFAYNGSSIQKIHCHVQFPESLRFPEVSLAKSLKNPSHTYILRSVICHFGQTPTRGHYIAYFRHGNHGWICADDSTVTQVKWSDVRDQQAYILFYELNKK